MEDYLEELNWLGKLYKKIGNNKKSNEIFLKLYDLSKIQLSDDNPKKLEYF